MTTSTNSTGSPDSSGGGWPRPVRTGLGPDDSNGHNRPADAVARVRWWGWWVDPVDLVAWHPDDPSYGLHLVEFVDPGPALRLVTHVVQRYHHPGPFAAAGLDARHQLAVGFVVMLEDVLQIGDRLSQDEYQAPTAEQVRAHLGEIAAWVAAGNDDFHASA